MGKKGVMSVVEVGDEGTTDMEGWSEYEKYYY